MSVGIRESSQSPCQRVHRAGAVAVYGVIGGARRTTAPGGRSITTGGGAGALGGAGATGASIVPGAAGVTLMVLPGSTRVGAIGSEKVEAERLKEDSGRLNVDAGLLKVGPGLWNVDSGRLKVD